jgi:hypothetical protein
MKREPIDSSSLASIGYDPRSATLEVAFHNGSIYRYAEVPAQIVSELRTAESPGTFFNENIRDVFAFVRLR